MTTKSQSIPAQSHPRDPLHKPLPEPVVVSMGRYSCFGSMAGKLWLITEKQAKEKK
jgi:hypothetical protein